MSWFHATRTSPLRSSILRSNHFTPFFRQFSSVFAKKGDRIEVNMSKLKKPSFPAVVGVTTLCSLWLAAIATDANKPLKLLQKFDEGMEQYLMSGERSKVQSIVQVMAEAMYQNDLLKRKLAEHPQYIDRLFRLLYSNDFKVRDYSAKILNLLCSLPDLQMKLLESEFHKRVLVAMSHTKDAMYLQKTLAFGLCHLAQHSDKAKEMLIDAGAVPALSLLLEEKQLQRHYIKKTIRQLAVFAVSRPDVMSRLDNKHAEQMRALAAEYEVLKATLAYRASSPLIESGILLYFHTGLGGGLWGLGTSLWQNESKAMLFQNTFRTAFITGMVPAYFVGFCVSAFTEARKRASTHPQVFWLYFGTTFGTILPWYYLLPVVEAWSPLWLGGHVVGFSLFFLYLIYSDADLIKSDEKLKILDTTSSKKSRKKPNDQDNSDTI
eukprot:g49388.t1